MVGQDIFGVLRDKILVDPSVRTQAVPHSFNSPIREGLEVAVIQCGTPWREVDTPNDLERAPHLFRQPVTPTRSHNTV